MAEQTPNDKGSGFLFKAYEKAKAALSSLAGKGKDAAGGQKPSARPHAGDDWKDKPKEPVSEADAVRSQEEMKESLGTGGKGAAASDETAAKAPNKTAAKAPGEPGSGDAQKRRGDVELESGYTTRPEGGEENPAAPDPGEVHRDDRTAAGLHEKGEVPQEGLGLDDGPRVKYSSDTGQ